MLGMVVDFVYAALQGVAVAGLLAGLIWMFRQSLSDHVAPRREVVLQPILLPVSGEFGAPAISLEQAESPEPAPEVERAPAALVAASAERPSRDGHLSP